MNKFILPTLIISLFTAPVTWAKKNHYESIEWARVTKVLPVSRMVEHHVPQETCWSEPVRQNVHRPNRQNNHNDNLVGTIVGGIVGGVIGNKVGHNRGDRKIGTVIGAVVGASVGNGLSQHHHSTPRHRPVNRHQRYCEAVTNVRYQEKVVGYDVWYRYHGKQYKTRMDHRPGHKIRVSVNVRPH